MKKMMVMRYLERLPRRVRFISNSTSTVGWWDHVVSAPKDPITTVNEAFLADPSPYKINLGLGAYRDDEGRPVKLQCVRDAETKIASNEHLESTSRTNAAKMVEESVKLVYGNGNDSDVIREGKVAGIQALSGTGACRLFADLQKRFHRDSPIYLPDPTWPNHHSIWRDAGVPTRTFRYYDPASKRLNFGLIMDDIKNAPEGSIFLLHPCAHNPTGTDPTEEQWREISKHFKVKNHFPFFDMAYQGFVSGNLDKDAKAVRIFLEDGLLIGCAQSFAKNMGLYEQRVGCLSVACTDATQATAVRSQLQQIARAMYGSPPTQGGLLVSTILSDPTIKALWLREVKVMHDRIQTMRIALREGLENSGSCLSWEHITNQVGMFCFSGLSHDEVNDLKRKYHVYMTPDGRISMAGVTTSNVSYLANAINQVTQMRGSYV